MFLMICLGIESTAHTFGIGIVNDSGEILANEKIVYKPEIGKGMVPREVADHHSLITKDVLNSALKKANLKLKDIDIISYSAGPGLPPVLKIGHFFGKYLSLKLGIPLIPVHHGIAHIEIGKLLTNTKDPAVLFLSGGHTAIIVHINDSFKVFGETLDITVGNAIDVFARALNLQMPGGPKIEQLAKKGKYVKMPYVVKGCDLSFAGLMTDAKRKAKEGIKPEDIAYSFQETAFSMLAEVTERAMAHTGKQEVILVGGVAANKRLCEMLDIMCKERGAKFFAVPLEYAGDCGANIGWAGIVAKQKNILPKIKTDSKWRIDEVRWV